MIPIKYQTITIIVYTINVFSFSLVLSRRAIKKPEARENNDIQILKKSHSEGHSAIVSNSCSNIS